MKSFDEQGIWVTKDGRQIKVTDLEDSHLTNIWNMMIIQVKPAISNMQCLEYLYGPRPNGEHSQDAWDWEFDQAMKGNLVTLEHVLKFPIMAHLYAEAQKRGLDVKI